MSYPPPHYGYPQQPPAGYRPPPGYPPAGYPPPQQPQWSPAGYQAPQGPPPGYQAPQGPPQGHPPQQAPPPKKRGGGFRTTLRVIGYGIGAVILVWAGLAIFLGDNPKQGDCLSSMDENWLASLDVVECDSPEAAYEVVEYDDNGSTGVCSGHDDGEVHRETGRRGKVYWSLCAVPK